MCGNRKLPLLRWFRSGPRRSRRPQPRPSGRPAAPRSTATRGHARAVQARRAGHHSGHPPNPLSAPYRQPAAGSRAAPLARRAPAASTLTNFRRAPNALAAPVPRSLFPNRNMSACRLVGCILDIRVFFVFFFFSNIFSIPRFIFNSSFV